MGKIKERIGRFIEYKGISRREFCRKIEVSPGFLVHDTDIGSDIVSKIFNTYPEVSLEWLIADIPPMIRSATSKKYEYTEENMKNLSEANKILTEINSELVKVNNQLIQKILRVEEDAPAEIACVEHLLKTTK